MARSRFPFVSRIMSCFLEIGVLLHATSRFHQAQAGAVEELRDETGDAVQAVDHQAHLLGREHDRQIPAATAAGPAARGGIDRGAH
jgi:hypothetical protein